MVVATAAPEHDSYLHWYSADVGGALYRIGFWFAPLYINGERCLGGCHPSERLILLDPYQSDDDLQDTVIHELFHASIAEFRRRHESMTKRQQERTPNDARPVSHASEERAVVSITRGGFTALALAMGWKTPPLPEGFWERCARSRKAA
jgi:hypothetical protein